MSRTVYVNGEYLPEEEAKVSIFDRSFLMADGVYEVTSVLGGKLIHKRQRQFNLIIICKRNNQLLVLNSNLCWFTA